MSSTPPRTSALFLLAHIPPRAVHVHLHAHAYLDARPRRDGGAGHRDPLAVLAVVFDVRGIRTFWRVDHPQRWLMTVLYLVVMGWLAHLLVRDIAQVLA